MTTANVLSQLGSPGVSTGFKNRIINGAMTIDQRNAGASVTPTNGAYTLDRWQTVLTQASKFTVQQNAGSVTLPDGFTNYLGITVGASANVTVGAGDLFCLVQQIEGFNIADLGWGTANAKTVTLSFQVRSSLTGTFAGSIKNGTNARSYPFTFSIASANTWTTISVTIAGDISGTWATTNGSGLQVSFSLGCGSTYTGTAGAWATANYINATGAVNLIATNGATFYITGVQLEVGTTATNFDYRAYGTELALCQRYFVELYGGTNPYQPLGLGNTYTTTLGSYCIYLPVPMRAIPSLTTSGAIYFQNLGAINISSFAGPYSQKATIVEGDFTMSSAVAVDRASFMRFNNTNTATSKFNYSAEL